ncbi:Salivary acidic proline-rich phosphoprotein 1/2 [Tilletia horrida]|nr:Salivary acidic proline-rich phosphoprotein 1/2 [Tilletia horrida]
MGANGAAGARLASRSPSPTKKRKAGAFGGSADHGAGLGHKKKPRRKNSGSDNIGTTSISNGVKSKYKNAPASIAGPLAALTAARSANGRGLDPSIAEARANLPVSGGRDAIIAALRQHDTIIVLGETGSGKTTQIPQFLFDAGFADDDPGGSGSVAGSSTANGHSGKKNGRNKIIGVTQPRRVAATSLASRVAAEMGCSDPAKLPMRSQLMNSKTKKGQQGRKAPALVGYSIRFDDRSGPETRIKFMTDGWILREMVGPSLAASRRADRREAHEGAKGKSKEVSDDASEDLSALLLSYAVVVIDEAHERTLDTDLILGLAKRIQRKRKELRSRWLSVHNADPNHPLARVTELKLVIMSATLDAHAFANFFASTPPLSISVATSAEETSPAPILYVEGRQHPVTLYHTPAPLQDWADAALRTILQIHTSKPTPGDILVFLTGQEEIEKLAASLRTVAEWIPDWANTRRQITGAAQAQENGAESGDEDQDSDEDEDTSDGEDADDKAESSDEDSSANPIDRIMADGLSKAKQNGNLRIPNGTNGVKAPAQAESSSPSANFPTQLLVAPIYAALGSSATIPVFAPTPAGARKVVLATNIAETSVTIPGIVYVIDCGFVKEKVYSPDSGIEVLRAVPISQGAARQRMGRAGRVRPGECFRLYTEAAFNTLEEVPTPEILKTDLSAASLQLYAARLDPFNFDWMDAPETDSLRAALLSLVQLGAVTIPDSTSADSPSAQITALGRRMAALPLSPVHARTLIAASERGGPTVARQARDLVALLSVDRSVFVDASGFAQGQAREAKKQANHADVEEAREEALSRRIRAGLIHRSGDHGTALNVLYAFLDVLDSSRGGKGAQTASVRAWSQANFVHEKTMRNVLHIRAQLRNLCRQNGIACDDDEEDEDGSPAPQGKKAINGHTPTANGTAKKAVNGASATSSPEESESSEDESSTAGSDEENGTAASTTGLYVTRKSISSLASGLSRAGWKEERYEALREVLCEGRIGNIAFRQTDGSYKRIGKGQTFKIHPSSALHGRGASAIFFEELVHTTQHFARTVSAIEPAWAQTAMGGGGGGGGGE